MAIFKVPRLTTAQRLTFTPEASEILFDTSNSTFYGGDGVTAGGVVLGTADDLTTQFTFLTDTPSSYAGAVGKFVRVNALEDGLEFFEIDLTIHKERNELVHNIAESNYTEIVRTDGKITNIIVWDTSDKLLKIREDTITRVDNKISTVVTKQYNDSGSLVETYTETIVRDSDGKIEAITGYLSNGF